MSHRAPAGFTLTWPLALLCLTGLLVPQHGFTAKTILDDPKGFRGIPWGANLDEIDELKLVSTWRIVTEYEYTDGLPRWADASLTSLRLSAVYGKFARVSIKYQGEQTHNQILGYLESRFGEIEYMPGAMVRGLNQQYTWRGTDTEINLTYQGYGERGFLFLESRTHAPRFNDVLPEHAY